MAEEIAGDDAAVEREHADESVRHRPNHTNDTADAEQATFQPWLLVAVSCVAVSVVCWWSGLYDAAFVTAAFGVVTWFMNQRAGFKKLRDENEHVEDDTADRQDEYDERG